MTPELEQRVLSCPTLPTLPAVALQILRLCRSDDVDLGKIADAIATDPALTARVLRAANSASMAARGKVGTLTRAVALLGSNAVLSIALSFTLVRNRRREEGRGCHVPGFWRRAVFSALAGRTLAEGVTPSIEPEEAFVAALLQDLGMLAMRETFRAEYEGVCTDSAGDHGALCRAERQHWSLDHAEVSALLARSWALPPLLSSALGASHGAMVVEATSAESRLLACVALSGPIADMWVAPGAEGACLRALEVERSRLGFDPAALEAVIGRMALAVPEASADFDIDLGSPGRAAEVLAEARRLRASLHLDGAGAAANAPSDLEAMDASLAFAIECARRQREPVALLHVACLPASEGPLLAEALRSFLRSTDLLFVEAGGDVLLLLPMTDLTGARVVAQRVQQRALTVRGLSIGIGIVGGEPPRPGASPARFRAAATRGIELAGVRGSGRVVVLDPPAGSVERRA